VSGNLLAILQHANAWNALSAPQQAELIALLPPAVWSEEGEENALEARLARSSAFQTDVRVFQDDLREGKLEPAWLELAAHASARRASGEFDQWRAEDVREAWGVEEEENVEN
jgi:Asx homology domain